jgi:hypothetical protein
VQPGKTKGRKKKMKKILCLLIVGIFLASSTTAMTIQKKDTTNIAEQENETILAAHPTVSAGSQPDGFSWLDYRGNWMTFAKDEGFCDSSFVFSAIGIFEAAINLASGYSNFDRDLSEQYVLSCLPAAGSCNGGWVSEAIAYIHSDSPGPVGNGINGVSLLISMPVMVL